MTELKVQVPEFIDMLLRPAPIRTAERKVWGIGLETVVVPFLTATNVCNKTAIPSEALGAPLRLQYDKDGQPKFSDRTGKPIIRVAGEIGQQVRLMRENYTANLAHFTATVLKAEPEKYNAEVQSARTAGQPIVERDRQSIRTAIMLQLQESAKKEASKTASPEPEPVTA